MADEKAELEEKTGGKKERPSTAVLVREEEEICKALYDKVTAELQRLESLHPSVRTKGAEELESYLEAIREKKESFLEEYNLLPNSTGAVSIIRMEESLADMLEEMGSFEVQVAERLRVLQLREKRVRDEEQASLEEIETFERSFRSEISRTGAQADVARIEYFEKQLREFLQDAGDQVAAMSFPDLKQKCEGILAGLQAEGVRLEAQKNDLLKKQEEADARQLLEQEKTRAEAFRKRLEGILGTDLQALEGADSEIRQMISGFKTGSEGLADQFLSGEIKSCRLELSELAREFESERGKLEDRIRQLKIVEREEAGVARKCLDEWSETQRQLFAETEGLGDQLSLIEETRAKIAGLSETLSTQMKGLLNTTGSEQVEEIRQGLSSIADQLSEEDQALLKKRNRLIRIGEERAAQGLYGEVEKALSDFKAAFSQSERLSSRELGETSKTLEDRIAELRDSSQKLENTVQSAGVSFLQSKIANTLNALEELEGRFRERFAEVNRKEKDRENEEAVARGVQEKLDATADRLRASLAKISGEDLPAIESLLQDVSENLKVFDGESRRLPDTTDSPIVKDLKTRILSLLGELENFEGQLTAERQSILKIEEQRTADESAARALKEKLGGLCASVTKDAGGLGAMTASEISEKWNALKEQTEACEKTYGGLTNATLSESVSRLSEECAGLLERLTGYEKVFSDAFGEAQKRAEKRRQEESAARELYERIRKDAGDTESELPELNGWNSSEIENFLSGLKKRTEDFGREYQGIENTTNSGAIEERIPLIAECLERLMECEKKASGVLSGVLQAEQIRRQREAEAAGLCGQIQTAIDETDREQKRLGENDPVAVRNFIESLRTRLETFRNAVAGLKGGETSSVIEQSVSQAERLLPLLEEAGKPAREKLRIAEVREKQRQKEESTVGALKERIEKDLNGFRAEFNARDAQNGNAIEDFLKRLGESLGIHGREYEAIQNTTGSRFIAQSSREIWELLDELERMGQEAEKDLEAIRKTEALRSEEELLARDLLERIVKTREMANAKISSFAGTASRDIELSLSDMEASIGRYGEELRGLKNTTSSQEISREASEAGKTLDALRGLAGEGRKILAAAKNSEAKREEEKQSARDFADRVKKALEIFRGESKTLTGSSSDSIEVFLEGMRGKISAYKDEMGCIVNTTGSEAVTRMIAEAGQRIEEIQALVGEGEQVLAGVKAREDLRSAEEKASKDLAGEIEREIGGLNSALGSLSGQNAREARDFLDALEGRISGWESEFQGLKNTFGSEEVERFNRKIAESLENLQGLQSKAENIYKGIEELEQRRLNEEASTERLERLIGKEKEALKEKMAVFGTKGLGIAEKETEDLKGAILNYEAEYGGLQNTAGSEKVSGALRRIQESMENLKGAEIEMERRLDDLRAREEIRLEENRLAEGLRKRVEREVGNAGAEFAELKGKPAAELGEYLDGFRKQLRAYEAEYGGLQNSSGSPEVDRAAIEISEFLAELQDVETEASRLLDEAKESEARGIREADDAKLFLEKVSGDLSGMQAGAGELEGKSSDEIEGVLTDLGQRLAEYETERNGLANTTGSETVTRMLVEADQVMEELKGFRLDIAEFLKSVRGFESRRNEEERIAKNFYDKVAKDLTALGVECRGLEGKDPAGMEAGIQALESRMDGIVREFSGLSNTTGSGQIAEIGSHVGDMLNETKNMINEEKEILKEKIAVEARRQEEVAAVKQVLAGLEETLGIIAKDFEGLERRSSAEVGNLAENLGSEARKYEALAAALKNTTGDPEISGEMERVGNLLEDLKRRKTEADEVLDQVRKWEQRQSDEEAAAGDLVRRGAEFLKGLQAAGEKLDLNDSASCGEFLKGLKGARGEFENELSLLKDTTGSPGVLESRRRMEGVLDGMSGIGKEVEGRLEELKAIENRRREEEQSARNLKAALESSLNRIHGEMQGLDQKSSGEIKPVFEAFRVQRAGFEEQYGQLGNTTASPAVSQLSDEIANLIAEMRRMENGIADILSEKRRFESRQRREKRAASILSGRLTKEAQAMNQEWESLRGEDSETIRGFLDRVRQSAEAYEAERKNIRNTTGSEEVTRLIGSVDQTLAGMNEWGKEIGKIFQEKKDSEIRDEEIQRLSQGLLERLRRSAGDLETVRNTLAEKDLPEMRNFSGNLRRKIAGFEEDFGKIQGMAGSPEAVPSHEAIQQLLAVLKDTGEDAESLLSEKIAVEARRQEEGAAVKQVLAGLEETLGIIA
ncbi:MAG TPA: hypothetical protein PKL97_01290, partial [Candidatus Omnitrophota bacterium]|nr:hypothetical protein [Candidatus Omnitrophota bacterium]